MTKMQGKRILLLVSGGIASYKCCSLVRLLMAAGHEVRVAMTPNAQEFVRPLVFEALSQQPVITNTWGDGEAMEHIAGAEWADLMALAPATANVIAKLAHGIADDVVGTLLLARQCPLLVAPAMNTAMWQNEATQANLATLAERGITLIAPGHGLLACRTVGPGKMAEPETIHAFIEDALQGPVDLRGERILVSAGPTQEHIDPFRFLSNPSSGRMGVAIAEAAWRAGGEVTLVHGPLATKAPELYDTHAVVSAAEMKDALEERFPHCTMLVMVAAIADFRPKVRHKHKIKKDSGVMNDVLELERTEDVIVGLAGQRQEGQIVVGFSAESQHALENSRRKLARKNLDMIVVNHIGGPESGFRSPNNEVTMLRPEHPPMSLPPMAKSRVAVEILRQIRDIRATLVPANNTFAARSANGPSNDATS